MSSFQINFRKIRADLGWSQSKTAKILGFNPSAISHFENGKREPSLKNILKICKGFGITPDVLLGFNG